MNKRINIKLINRLAVMEYGHLKEICPFMFNSSITNHTDIIINKDFTIHNNNIILISNNKTNDVVLNNIDNSIWIDSLYFKNGFKHKILFMHYLQGKYRIL
tara:strand:+ start:679 stop:981 length:303 start_codon:yes stop_codon:yes gene_type:complete